MNEIEKEDRRGRARLSAKAAVKAGLIAGVIVFILPGGGPWMSFDTGLASMGRVMTNNVIAAAAIQLVLALIYAGVIAAVIWHRKIWSSVVLGVLTGLGLYCANFVMARAVTASPGNETHVIISHIVFSLICSVLYRAFAVPTVKDLKEHADQHHAPSTL